MQWQIDDEIKKYPQSKQLVPFEWYP
jgi:hypothetical protein